MNLHCCNTHRLQQALIALSLMMCGMIQQALAAELSSDVLMEKRFADLSEQLRCPKCQNQSLADSDAIISRDLRRQLRELLQQGYSNAEVKQYMAARYGNFILYDPPVERATLVLWFAPLLLILLGAVILYRISRSHHRTSQTEHTKVDTLNQAEAKRLANLLVSQDSKVIQVTDDA